VKVQLKAYNVYENILHKYIIHFVFWNDSSLI